MQKGDNGDSAKAGSPVNANCKTSMRRCKRRHTKGQKDGNTSGGSVQVQKEMSTGNANAS